MEDHGDEEITFYDRNTTTIGALIDRLISQMDMMYFHFIDGVAFDDEDEEWIAAKKLLYNPTGWMDGGSSYGLVIGGYGGILPFDFLFPFPPHSTCDIATG